MILPECRWHVERRRGAPTRWWSTRTSGSALSFDCSIYFVRDPADSWCASCRPIPSYLQTAADGRVKNYRDWGVPLGPPHARAEALVRDPRAGRRAAAGSACAAISHTRNGWPREVRARAALDDCSRRCALQTLVRAPRAAGPRLADAVPTRTAAPGRRRSTSPARRISRPRSSTDAGRCACPSAAPAPNTQHVDDLWRLMREMARDGRRILSLQEQLEHEHKILFAAWSRRMVRSRSARECWQQTDPRAHRPPMPGAPGREDRNREHRARHLHARWARRRQHRPHGGRRTAPPSSTTSSPTWRRRSARAVAMLSRPAGALRDQHAPARRSHRRQRRLRQGRRGDHRARKRAQASRHRRR